MARPLRSAAAALTALGLLTACSACSSGGSSGDSAKKTVITFWDNNAGPARTPLFQHLIDGFEKEHPEIEVKYVGVTSSEVAEKYNTAIAAHSTPDVGGVTTALLASLTAQKALVPLDDRLAGSPLKGELSAAMLETSRAAAGGKGLYQLPSSGNQDVIWYRADKFEAAGIAVPKTWDELFAAAAKLTDKPANQYGFTIRGGAGSGFQVLAEAYAYSGITGVFDADGKSTVDDPRNVELIAKIAAQYRNTTPEADVSNAYPQMLAQFQAGQVMMVHHNLGSTKDVKSALGDKAAGMLLPAGPDGTATLANPVDGFGVFKNSKHQDAAWTFLEYLDSHASNSYWNENAGQIPANTAAYADDWYVRSGITKQAGDALNSGKLVQPPVYLPQYSKITKTEAEPNFQKVLLGQMSPADFAASVAGALTKAQADYRAKNG
ncbi:sugar ABC transporter substrate-binding protein [Kitasatospora saccharophila]|uniref:Sugar ABC transporter substrate-binding protein n=1 Tax=Kitasatospora saccharophila TaxID=407973 RepID=A0ABN2XEE2_9ACTN